MKRSTEQFLAKRKVNKIILVLWNDKPGGIEVLLPDIIRNCTDYSFEVFVLRKRTKKEKSVFNQTAINVTYGSNSNIKLYYKLFTFARENRESIFHLFNAGPMVLLVLWLGAVKNIIYSIHGTVYWKALWKKVLLKLIWFIAIRKHVTFTSNSEYSKAVFLSTVKNNVPVHVIYNPFDINRFQPVKRTKSNYKNFNIAYVSRLAPGKNLMQWLKLAERIYQNHPQTQFKIYGDGLLYEKVNAYIEKNRLGGYIKLAGHIKQVQKAYQSSDLLLFLSSRESFGNVVVESILCGTPVIASRIPSLEEIFQNYPQFLVSLDNRLEKNILAKLAQYNELKDLALKARREFLHRFSLEKHLMELNLIYENARH